MSFGQMGWVDAIGFGVSLLLVIPTGAFADIFGKRLTLILSNLFAMIGILVIAFSNSFTGIFVGNIITQIGWAMYSGAADALAYDSLLSVHEESLFSIVLAKANQYMSYAAAFGYFVGGILYALYWRLPHIVWGLSYIPGIIVAFLLVEPKIAEKEHFSVKAYINKIHLGIKELLLPQLRKYILLILILLGVYFLYTWGFVRPAIATSFGFYSQEQSIILPILTLSAAFLLQYLPFIQRKISGFMGLSILAFIMAFGFFISAFHVGYWGIIPMILIVIAGRFGGPWVSLIINNEISSSYRATTLSTVSLLSKVPYVVVAVLIGSALEKNMLSQFCFVLAGIILFATLLSGGLYIQSKTKKA